MLGGGYVLRSIVGLAIVGLLGGCAAGATVVPPPATPAVPADASAAIATPSPATPGASMALAAPTATATRPPLRTPKPMPTIGVPADDGARVTWVQAVDTRTRNLTIDSPAVGSVQVQLLLPSRFDAMPSTRWPVLYLLTGYGGSYSDWGVNTDVAALTAPTDLLVVMPDGGYQGWFSDWWNGGSGGPPKWETFHLVELRQLLERNWHAGDKRAIAGLSMGGYGAMEYAERQPGTFAAAASYSGVLDPLGGQANFSPPQPNDIWGDPVAQADVWKAHDPTDNAAALKGTALYVAYGNGQTGPLDPSKSPDLEAWIATENETFLHQLAALKIPVTVDAYGNGTHDWPYWQRDLHRSLPFILKALSV